MTKPFLVSVDYRQPFAMDRLAPLVAMTVWAQRIRNRNVRRLAKKLTRTLFRITHNALGFSALSRMTLETGAGSRRVLVFDARNTGFGALYLTEHGGGYETGTAALIRHLMPKDGVFFDVGANWGFFSLLMAAEQGFTGTVHAFEPVPETRRALESLVDQAMLSGRVLCHRLGLSNYDGSAGLIRDKVHSGLARLGDKGATESVAVAQLDSLELGPPDVVKIDVEGHEAAVLAGASETLRVHRPAVVFESLTHGDEPARTLEPFRILQEAGYVFFQSAWAADWKGGRYFVPEDIGLNGMLALRPVSGEDRFLMGRVTNVLGWPVERIDALRDLFPGQ